MAQYVEVARKIIEEVKKAVIGKDECVKKNSGCDFSGRTYFNRRYTGSREDNDGGCLCQKHDSYTEQGAVHTGCTSGGYHRIFHV